MKTIRHLLASYLILMALVGCRQGDEAKPSGETPQKTIPITLSLTATVDADKLADFAPGDALRAMEIESYIASDGKTKYRTKEQTEYKAFVEIIGNDNMATATEFFLQGTHTFVSKGRDANGKIKLVSKDNLLTNLTSHLDPFTSETNIRGYFWSIIVRIDGTDDLNPGNIYSSSLQIGGADRDKVRIPIVGHGYLTEVDPVGRPYHLSASLDLSIDAAVIRFEVTNKTGQRTPAISSSTLNNIISHPLTIRYDTALGYEFFREEVSQGELSLPINIVSLEPEEKTYGYLYLPRTKFSGFSQSTKEALRIHNKGYRLVRAGTHEPFEFNQSANTPYSEAKLAGGKIATVKLDLIRPLLPLEIVSEFNVSTTPKVFAATHKWSDIGTYSQTGGPYSTFSPFLPADPSYLTVAAKDAVPDGYHLPTRDELKALMLHDGYNAGGLQWVTSGKERVKLWNHEETEFDSKIVDPNYDGGIHIRFRGGLGDIYASAWRYHINHGIKEDPDNPGNRLKAITCVWLGPNSTMTAEELKNQPESFWQSGITRYFPSSPHYDAVYYEFSEYRKYRTSFWGVTEGPNKHLCATMWNGFYHFEEHTDEKYYIPVRPFKDWK